MISGWAFGKAERRYLYKVLSERRGGGIAPLILSMPKDNMRLVF